jgi:malonyl-CoA/methylmalonyl-CoA synthetase
MSLYHRLQARWVDPERIALTNGEVVVSYGELVARVQRACGLIADAGLQRGDVLALQLPRSPGFVELFLAALASGVAVVPINDRSTDAEVGYALADARAKLAILPTDTSPALPPACAVLRATDLVRRLSLQPAVDVPTAVPDDAIAVIAYTSGTTGRPKGAAITHANLLAMVTALHDAWRWSPEDRLLHALPLFHIHGLFVAQLGALWANARTDQVQRFDALDTLRAIDRLGSTLFMGVPTFYQRFIELPEALRFDLSRVRLFTCGSAPLPAHVLDAFERRFGHRILERYGMTEVGIVLSNPYDGVRRAGTVGLPLPGVVAAIADATTDAPVEDGAVGELRIGGPTVFGGYLNSPEKTAASFDAHGRVRTGDLAVRDPDGYFRIVGRLRDLVIAGGLNVYPSEVESVLLDHPDVAEIACVGVIDIDLGERLVADVVLKPDVTVGPDALPAWAKHRLAPYKCPRAWRFVASLPRNAMGKVDKKQIRAEWETPSVRPGRATDVNAIATANLALALESEGLRLEAEAAFEGVRAVFDRNVGARYFVAEVAGAYAGQVMITTEWSDWRARPIWWLQSAYVHPAYRRRGVFKALFDAVVGAARHAGAAGIRLYADRNNADAQAVYRRLDMDGDHYRVFETMFIVPEKAVDQ